MNQRKNETRLNEKANTQRNKIQCIYQKQQKMQTKFEMKTKLQIQTQWQVQKWKESKKR